MPSPRLTAVHAISRCSDLRRLISLRGDMRLRPMSVRPTRATMSKGGTRERLYRVFNQNEYFTRGRGRSRDDKYLQPRFGFIVSSIPFLHKSGVRPTPTGARSIPPQRRRPATVVKRCLSSIKTASDGFLARLTDCPIPPRNCFGAARRRRLEHAIRCAGRCVYRTDRAHVVVPFALR